MNRAVHPRRDDGIRVTRPFPQHEDWRVAEERTCRHSSTSPYGGHEWRPGEQEQQQVSTHGHPRGLDGSSLPATAKADDGRWVKTRIWGNGLCMTAHRVRQQDVPSESSRMPGGTGVAQQLQRWVQAASVPHSRARPVTPSLPPGGQERHVRSPQA